MAQAAAFDLERGAGTGVDSSPRACKFPYSGETIWTESSHKFRLEEIPALAERTGFRCDGRWVDAEWPFAQNLFTAV